MKTNNIKGLVGIIAAGVILSGCEGMGPKRATIYEANTFQGTSGQYFADTSRRETGLDAAETDRERRCLYAMNGATYFKSEVLYKDLSKCVGQERAKDMAMFLPLAVVIDGLKLYALFAGSKNAVNEISGGSNSSNITTGYGFASHKIGNVTH